MRFLMVYALLRCHVRNTLKRGAFWRPSGPDTPARFTPRATWSSLELTRVGDHCGPGRHQEFFFGPTKRHCIRPGVAGGRGAATMARGALKTGDIALLHFFTHMPFSAKIACHTCNLVIKSSQRPERKKPLPLSPRSIMHITYKYISHPNPR